MVTYLMIAEESIKMRSSGQDYDEQKILLGELKMPLASIFQQGLAAIPW